MHYRLRPIKEIQFGFAYFVSHFIRVQIFQIDFPLILHLKGTKWTLLNQISKEKGTLKNPNEPFNLQCNEGISFGSQFSYCLSFHFSFLFFWVFIWVFFSFEFSDNDKSAAGGRVVVVGHSSEFSFEFSFQFSDFIIFWFQCSFLIFCFSDYDKSAAGGRVVVEHSSELWRWRWWCHAWVSRAPTVARRTRMWKPPVWVQLEQLKVEQFGEETCFDKVLVN